MSWVFGTLVVISACGESTQTVKNPITHGITSPQNTTVAVSSPLEPASSSPSSSTAERRTTRAGVVFERVYDTNLGESVWQDVSNLNGVIWGTSVRDENGDVAFVEWREAFQYCLDLNPEEDRELIFDELRAGADNLPALTYYLPTQQDWILFRVSFGGASEESIVPNGRVMNYELESWFPDMEMEDLYWSSTFQRMPELIAAFHFDSLSGRISLQGEHLLRAFRCVRKRAN